MRTKNIKNNRAGYLSAIQKVWDLKEQAHTETKEMNYSELVKYIQNDIQNIKNNLKDKYVKI